MKITIETETYEEAMEQLKKAFTPKMEMVKIPAGTFLMGSPDDDEQAHDDEKPQKEVTVKAFSLSKTPVTRAQYRHYMGQEACPEQWKEYGNLPATHISWRDCLRLANAASEKEGLTPVYQFNGESVTVNPYANGYYLPTEEEWEYAARAGTTTPRFCSEKDLPEHAVYNTSELPEVGTKKPNPWGLHDMLGCVWEWTYSEYTDD